MEREMQLKEFVKKTIEEIIDGVNEAKGETITVIADENANKDRIKNIDFRLNIAGETDDDGVILVDPRNYNPTKKQHITRLKFSVPIAFK
jgi:hypothetical protein